MSALADTLVIVFAGERGQALGSLTADRAKAAIPFGGEYRIIDFCLSNCLHSGLRRIYVLTQFHAHSLHEHLRTSWGVFNSELHEFITPVPPQLRDGERWYAGSAQAIFDNLFLIERSGARHVLVINGGYLYRMDFEAVLQSHRSHKAQLTLVYADTTMANLGTLDRLELGEAQRVTGFVPRNGSANCDPSEADEAVCGSLGAMVYETDVLMEQLGNGARQTTLNGGGLAATLVPKLIDDGHVFGYRFGGRKGRVSQDRFFSQVGSIDAYFDANMALLEPIPPLDLYQEDWPIWGQSRRLPPARTVASRKGNEGIFVNSIVSNGTIIEGGAVSHSVLCPQVRVADSAAVERCILFDGVRVGRGCELRNCIVDKNVEIPDGERIGFDARVDAQRFEVTGKGVVVVPRGYRWDD